MAHYALLDENNVVVNIIVGHDENDPLVDWEAEYAKAHSLQCVRTSYNANIRKRYAAIGGTYNPELDIFLDPQPYPSWTIDATEQDWVAPSPRPVVKAGDFVEWNEELLEWVVNPPRPQIG